MKLALAAFVILAGSALPAPASENVICAEPPSSPSIIHLGDMCEFAEPEVVAVEEEVPTDKNVALVDEYGMPTSMPVIMRPSVDSAPAAPATAAATPAETTPAASTPAAPATSETKPAAPAPQPQTDAKPAPSDNQNADPKIQ